jgi:hypothetical protein
VVQRDSGHAQKVVLVRECLREQLTLTLPQLHKPLHLQRYKTEVSESQDLFQECLGVVECGISLLSYAANRCDLGRLSVNWLVNTASRHVIDTYDALPP